MSLTNIAPLVAGASTRELEMFKLKYFYFPEVGRHLFRVCNQSDGEISLLWILEHGVMGESWWDYLRLDTNLIQHTNLIQQTARRSRP